MQHSPFAALLVLLLWGAAPALAEPPAPAEAAATHSGDVIFDPSDPPRYAVALDEPGGIEFVVPVVNRTGSVQRGWVEVAVCLAGTGRCVHAGAAYAPDGARKRGKRVQGLAPFGRGSARFSLPSALPAGAFSVTLLAFAGDDSRPSDVWSGTPIEVGGRPHVRVLRISYPGDIGRGVERGDAAELSVTLQNLGTGGGPIWALFVIDGGAEVDRGWSISTDPVLVPPTGDAHRLSAAWPVPTAGAHLLSVMIYDAQSRLLYERRGIPFVM
jgi:hypothetical protein